MDLKKVRELGKSTQIWKSTQIFKKFTYLKKIPEFENIKRTWKRYANLSRHGQNRVGTAPKPVKTVTRDESCPVSEVKGASCPVLKLRDQI